MDKEKSYDEIKQMSRSCKYILANGIFVERFEIFNKNDKVALFIRDVKNNIIEITKAGVEDAEFQGNTVTMRNSLADIVPDAVGSVTLEFMQN